MDKSAFAFPGCSLERFPLRGEVPSILLHHLQQSILDNSDFVKGLSLSEMPSDVLGK